MRAKYEEILVPRAEVLFDPEERQYITFGAFFANTMFHEVAHGKANMIQFSYFQEKGVFESDSASSTYRVNYDQIQQAMNDLSQDTLILHSDYDEVAQLVAEKRQDQSAVAGRSRPFIRIKYSGRCNLLTGPGRAWPDC